MKIDQIALGRTYQLLAREVGNPHVVVERVEVYATATPGFLRDPCRAALVYVYETASNTRYPVMARDLRSVKG
jgi:hypothetical protein